jgi:peptidyl-tRNA hydrolase
MDKTSRENELKLYAIVRSDLLPIFAMESGKLVAQGGHAFLGAALDAQKRFPAVMDDYLAIAQPKITLKIKNERQMLELYESHRHLMGAALICDEGRTVFNGPTVTFLGLGPCRRADLPKKLQTLGRIKQPPETSDLTLSSEQ